MMSLHGVRWLGAWMVCTLFAAGCSTPAEDRGLRALEAEVTPREIAQLQKEAESGDPTAQRLLAFAYQEGRGVALDHAAAIEWHKKAAKEGELDSQAALGRYFITGMGGTQKQPFRGLFWLRKAAHAGNADAQALLGVCYLHGVGRSLLRANQEKAEKWLKAASDQGVAQAKYDLATLYYRREDYGQTAKWLEKAAAQDHPLAHTLLSTLYQEGQGVAVDEAESVRLLRRAAVLGDPVSQTDLGVALREGSRLAQNARESYEWFEKAAAQGYVDGQFNLALAYLNGTGVNQDRVRGVAWLEICRDKNSRDAIRTLGWARKGLTPDQLQAARGLQEKLAANSPEYHPTQ